MAVPDSFLPRAYENAELQKYRVLNQQLRDYALDGRAADRGQRLLRRYAKQPWLSPGVATAYEKWVEMYGQGAARGLASQAFSASQAPDATNKSVNSSLEDFVATKDFQRQVKSYRESQQDDGSFFDSIVDNIPVVNATRSAIRGDFAKAGIQSITFNSPGFYSALKNSDKVPGVGSTLKGITRTAFTALESPYQEVQATASSILGHTAQAFQGAAATATSRQGSSTNILQPTNPVDNGLQVGDQSPLGTSTGAIALDRLFSGDSVDLGTGFLPGGQVVRDHERAVRNIASFRYGGKTHFATPGRIVASTITEPGTDPYNVLSGTVDALAIIKADPANIALTKLGEIRAASKGFRPAELESAGAISNWWRGAVDGPTVQQWLDNPRRGGAVLDDFATNFAGRDDALAELGRRTGWQYPEDVYRGIIEAPAGDRDAVRAVLEPALGTSIDRQPQIRSFGAAIKNQTGTKALLSELPVRTVVLREGSLGGPNGSLRALYNHALGIGIDDATISRRLSNILKSDGRVTRSEAVFEYLGMEADGLIAKGVPEQNARSWARIASEELAHDRLYSDHLIGNGLGTPGAVVDGTIFPVDKPFLPSEFLSDTITLPELTGKNGRGQLLAKYGNLLGIPGTSIGAARERDLLGEESGLQDFLHGIQSGAYRSNTAGIHLQNVIWKPLALIRGAWTVRVLAEEQLRMAMAGYANIYTHPISYIAWGMAKKEGDSQALLDYAADQRAMRGSIEGAFGYPDSPVLRFKGRETVQYAPDAQGYHAAWADTLTRYSEDPMMNELAKGLTSEYGDPTVTLDNLKSRFWNGDLTASRADLSEARGFIDAGIDLSTRRGSDAYIDNLYDRLHYYTQGDSELINTIANKQYTPSAQSLATRSSLKGQRVTYDGMTGEVVEHRARGKQARVLFDDGTDQPLAVSHLELEAADEPTKLLTQNADGVRIDEAFVNHLRTRAVVPDQVTGLRTQLSGDEVALYDRATKRAFAFLMDIPATKLNRSHVFLESYYDEVERLLPWTDEAGRMKLLREARQSFGENAEGFRGVVMRVGLKDRRKALEAAASKGGAAKLTYEEADTIAKGKALDDLRTLLYDTHKKNKSLAALQLLFPFGEAWKEMFGSWARIIAEKPQTVRKMQVAVNAARGANPFSSIPGAVPDAYADRGFFYKDPSNNGADTFVYPFTSLFNEQLIGVPIPFTGQAQSLSMGFNLIPGVGPAFQVPATYFLDRYADNKTWDPVRHLIAPYGAPDPSEGNLIEQTFAPAWLKKWATAAFGDPKGTNQDARALNSTIMDVMSYGASTGEYDLNDAAGVQSALKDAESKARWLYFLRGTFQFGAPAAPRPEFLAEEKNGKLVTFSVFRDELQKMYTKDPDTAIAKFIDRFGEKAMFAARPKTLGSVFGQQYTQGALDWERDNKGLVDKYPLSFAEFAPRTDDEPFSPAAYLRASMSDQREQIKPKDWVARTQNVLGGYWYDRARAKLGLADGAAGTKAQRDWLRDVRAEIHTEYPSWRLVDTDDTRIPRVVEELVRASRDPAVKRSNPKLAESLKTYVGARNQVIKAVRAQGGGGDFTRPGFADGDKWAPYRQYLRDAADAIGQDNPQFLVLWQDTFEREMSED